MTELRERPNASAARRGRSPTKIGEWVLFPDLGVLRRGDEELRLTAKSLHVLLVLIDAESAGVSRNSLLDSVWGHGYPSDAVVSRAISDLRSAFGESAGEKIYIRTLPKFGYQLVAECTELDDSAGDSPAPFRPQGKKMTVIVIGLTVLGVLGFFAMSNQGTDLSGVSVTLRLPVSAPLTSAPGLEHQPRIVPSGDWVVYAALRPEQADWDLFRVSTRDGASQVVAASPGIDEHGPAVSPGGDDVAYVRIAGTRCDVVVQSITLGVPQRLAACTSRFATTVDWSPDDRWIAFTAFEPDDPDGRRRLHVIDRKEGEQRVLSKAVTPTGSDYYPRFSPSGKRVAFLRGEPQPDHRASLWLVDIGTGIEERLTSPPSQLGGVTWLDESTLLYVHNDAGQFVASHFDLETGTETRLDQIGLIHPEYREGAGALVATRRSSERDLMLIEKDASVVPLAQSTSDDHHGVFSPDEAFVAFVSRRSGHDELWIADVDNSASRRLTHYDGVTLRYPDWHPSDARLLYTAQTDAGERLFEVDVVSGSSGPLGGADVEATTPRWLADGEGWVFACRDANGWGVCVGDDGGHRRVADDYFRPAPLGPDSIAVVDSAGVLYRISLPGGEVDVLFDRLPGNGRLGWALVDNTLFYTATGIGGSTERLVRRNLDSGAEATIFTGQIPMADSRISVGTITGRVLLTAFQAASDDLVVFAGAFDD